MAFDNSTTHYEIPDPGTPKPRKSRARRTAQEPISGAGTSNGADRPKKRRGGAASGQDGALPLAITNAEFLAAIFGGEQAVYLTGFMRDPGTKGSGWGGWLTPLSNLRLPNTTGNTYFSIAAFPIDAPTRESKSATCVRAFVLDDPIDPPDKMPLKPSYVMQTGPHTTQVGFLTHAPVERIAKLQSRLVANKVIKVDPSGNGPQRWVRLPEGHNTKAKYGTPFKHQMLGWNPERTYTIEALEAAFGAGGARPLDRPEKTQPGAAQADGERVSDGDLIADIISGKTYHDPTIRLAARYAGRGMERDAIVATLQGIFTGAPYAKDTWAERFDDIERSVDSAIAKYAPKAMPKLDFLRATNDDGTERRTGFLVSAHEIEDENIDWVWKHRLARGALHLIAGHPGTAKSTIAFGWAATISSGGKFPDGTLAPTAKVAIWTGEDNLATTVKPRMRAAGANFDNVIFIAGKRKDEKGENVHFNPAEHMPQLREELEQHPDIALVIIDPIVAMIKGKSDSHKNAEVRKDLQPLVDLLEDRGVIGIGITHFTKGTSGKHIVERITGSLAFGAVARMAYCTVQEKDEPNKYRLVLGKTNIAPLGGGYEYQITLTEMPVNGKTIEATKIIWGDKLEGDPLKLIADAEGPPTGRPPEKREDAVKLLNDLLADGPALVTVIKKASEAHGVSMDTLRRAAKRMGVTIGRVKPNDNRSPYQWATTAQTISKATAQVRKATARKKPAKKAVKAGG